MLRIVVCRHAIAGTLLPVLPSNINVAEHPARMRGDARAALAQ